MVERLAFTSPGLVFRVTYAGGWQSFDPVPRERSPPLTDPLSALENLRFVAPPRRVGAPTTHPP